MGWFLLAAEPIQARMSAKISALISGGTPEQIEAFGRFAESVGVAFQIQDDLLNIDASKLADSKGQIGEVTDCQYLN